MIYSARKVLRSADWVLFLMSRLMYVENNYNYFDIKYGVHLFLSIHYMYISCETESGLKNHLYHVPGCNKTHLVEIGNSLNPLSNNTEWSISHNHKYILGYSFQDAIKSTWLKVVIHLNPWAITLSGQFPTAINIS